MTARSAFNSVMEFFIPSTSSERSRAIHRQFIEDDEVKNLSSSTIPPEDAQVPKAEPTSSKLKSDPVLKAKKSKTLDAERAPFIIHERHSRRRAKDEVLELSNDIEREKETRRRLQKDLTDACQRIAAMSKTVESQEKDREDFIVQYNALQSKLTSRDQKLISLEERNWKQQQELQMLKDKLKIAEEKCNQMEKLLEERTDDLKGAETFITTADLYSGAEVVNMVETLNAEIFQTAANVSELLEDVSSRATAEEHKHDIQSHKNTLEIVYRSIGPDLFLHLQNRVSDVQADPLPLQLALQGVITAWCLYRIQTFTPGQGETEFRKLYNKIRMSEIQSVTGRWRSITYAQLHDPQAGPDASLLLQMMLSLLCLCGWSPGRGASHLSSMRNMVSGIEKLQMQLKGAIKQGITTSEVDVFQAGQTSFSDQTMEDEYSKDMYSGSGNGEKVLLTVGLGLQKSTIKVGRDREKRESKDILIKSKVALAFVLHR